MSSEIGNKALLRRIAAFLEVLDVKQMASRLKTDEVIPVVDIGSVGSQAPLAAFNDYELQSGSFTVDVSATPMFSATIMSPAVGKDARVLALDFSLDGDAAIAAANISTEGSLVYGESSFKLWDFYNWEATLASGAWKHRFALWGHGAMGESLMLQQRPININWNGFIPEECAVNFKVEMKDAASNFPANTELTVNYLYLEVNRGRLQI